FADVRQSDWAHTNFWLKSAGCARETGAWLVMCRDDGRLIPISEEAIGDDPGHALMLGVWAILSAEAVSLVDAARLNIVLNTAGLVMLAAFLFGMRAYLCALLFLYLGPV